MLCFRWFKLVYCLCFHISKLYYCIRLSLRKSQYAIQFTLAKWIILKLSSIKSKTNKSYWATFSYVIYCILEYSNLYNQYSLPVIKYNQTEWLLLYQNYYTQKRDRIRLLDIVSSKTLLQNLMGYNFLEPQTLCGKNKISRQIFFDQFWRHFLTNNYLSLLLSVFTIQ